MTKNDHDHELRPAPATSSKGASRVDAQLLIPGRGDPIQDASLVYQDGKIVFVGPRKDLPSQYEQLHHTTTTTTTTTRVPVLMPGLWDCHVHFLGATSHDFDQVVLGSPALAGARLARDAAATLNAGFTSVRELAGYGGAISAAIDGGWLAGPRIYSAHAILSQTAGHGDTHNLPLELVRSAGRHGVPFQLCDGVDECLKGVRAQLRKGAQVIKLCATGGVLSLRDSPQAAQFSPAELGAIVGEAARAGRVVAAHCHGKAGIMAALRAGCRTVEHGTYLDQEAVDLLLAKDAILVATRSISAWGVRHPEAFAPPVYAKMVAVADTHRRAYRLAVASGVRVALGTDLGVSSAGVAFNHGMNGREFGYAVEAGLSPLRAIEAGTANGPLTLGWMGGEGGEGGKGVGGESGKGGEGDEGNGEGLSMAPKSGQLKAGFDADFIAVAENPLLDIDVLATPRLVTHVWKGGVLYKEPGREVGFLWG